MNNNQHSTMLNHWRASRARLFAYVIYELGEKSKDLTVKKALDIFCKDQGIERPQQKVRDWLIEMYDKDDNKILGRSSKVATKRNKRKKASKKRGKAYKNGAAYKTKEWIELRKLALKRDNNTCQRCGKKKNLHVHHEKYASNSKNYLIVPLTDLLTVCKPCHQVIHGREF
jgi:hypothetical protein